MTTYKTLFAINDPRDNKFIPKDTELTKEDYTFLFKYQEAGDKEDYYRMRESICSISIGQQIIRSSKELIADILDSAKYLTQETLGEMIEILQKNLRAMSKTEETKPDPITETPPEVKLAKK